MNNPSVWTLQPIQPDHVNPSFYYLKYLLQNLHEQLTLHKDPQAISLL